MSDDAPAPEVQLFLARLEAKLDVALAQHGAKLDEHSRDLADHEQRLRVQEAKPTVSPRALWTFALGAVGALGALVPLISHVY